jgi:hypothetical protein
MLTFFKLLVATGVAFASVSPLLCADDDSAIEWIRTPLSTDAMTARDASARAELRRLIDKLQDESFRRDITLDIPERATGLPASYDLHVYGTYTDRAQRIEIHVRDGKATTEFGSTHRFARRTGELPFDRVDQLTRELLYGAMTRHVRRAEAGPGELTYSIASRTATYYASHALYFRIDIKSCDPERPLRLMTEARQTANSAIDLHDSGVRGFIHAHFCNELLKIVFQHLEEVPPANESAAEAMRRLNALADRVKNMDKVAAARVRADETAEVTVVERDAFDEDDVERTIVEARVLGQQAVSLRCKDAADVLEELGQKSLARALRLATANDGGVSLRKALIDEDWDVFAEALDLASEKLDAAAIQNLVEVLPHLADSYRMAATLQTLESSELTPEQIAAIRVFHRDAPDERARVAAARLLLFKTDDNEIFDQFGRTALEPVKLDGSDIDSPVFTAGYAVVVYAIAKGTRREAAADLVRKLLDRIPTDAHPNYSGRDWLSRSLGQLGDRSDLPRLEMLAASPDLSVNVEAIRGLSYLDGRRAMELARSQMQWYLEGRSNSSYGWSVQPYFSLIFWQRDVQSVPLLERALARYRQAPEVAEEPHPDIEALFDYLRAERVEDRVSAALRFVKYHWVERREWCADVGRRLVEEGADRDSCRLLFDPPNRDTWLTEYR